MIKEISLAVFLVALMPQAIARDEAIRVMCPLSFVGATHAWKYGNQLARVCEYRCPREVSKYKNFYPDTYVIPYNQSCPAEALVKICAHKDRCPYLKRKNKR